MLLRGAERLGCGRKFHREGRERSKTQSPPPGSSLDGHQTRDALFDNITKRCRASADPRYDPARLRGFPRRVLKQRMNTPLVLLGKRLLRASDGVDTRSTPSPPPRLASQTHAGVASGFSPGHLLDAFLHDLVFRDITGGTTARKRSNGD